VYGDIGNAFTVYVAAYMIPLVNDKAALSPLGGFVREHRAEQPRADDQVIIFHFPASPSLFL
jgi:hypothetical protein